MKMTKSDSCPHISLLPEHWSHVVSQMVDNDDLNSVYSIQEIRPLICGDVWIRPTISSSDYQIDYSLREPFDDDFDDTPLHLISKPPKYTTLDFISETVMFEHVEDIDGLDYGDVFLASNTVTLRDIRPHESTIIDKGKKFKCPPELKAYLKTHPILVIHISTYQCQFAEITGFLGYIMHYFPNLFVRIAIDKAHREFSIPEDFFDAIEGGSLIGFDFLDLDYFNGEEFYRHEKWNRKLHDNYNYYLPQLESIDFEFESVNFSKISHIKIDAPILEDISLYIGDGCHGGDLDEYFQNFHAPNVTNIKIKSCKYYEDEDISYHKPELNIPLLLNRFPKLKSLAINTRKVKLTFKGDSPCYSKLEELELLDNGSQINFDELYLTNLKSIYLGKLEDLRGLKPILERAQNTLEDISVTRCGGLNSIENLTFPKLRSFDFICHQIYDNNVLTFSNLELPECTQLAISIHVVGLILKKINAPKLKKLEFDVQHGIGWSINERFDGEIDCPNLKELRHKLNSIDEISELLIAPSTKCLDEMRCARRKVSENLNEWYGGFEHVFTRNRFPNEQYLWIEEESLGIPFEYVHQFE